MKNRRQQEILELLKKHGYVSTINLAKATFSSTPTIRRDLMALEAAGYIVRNHGGAILLPEDATVTPADFRKIDRRAEKQQLCAAAIKLLKEHQTIFIDESTTLLPLAKMLSSFKNMIVVTNNTDVLPALKNSSLELYCTGGKCNNNNNFIGRFTEEFISRFNYDVCLFSSTGITSDGRIMDKNEHKVGIVEAILKHSKEKIYLCDQSKIDKCAKFNIVDACQLTTIITTAKEDSLKLSPERIIYVTPPPHI